MWSCWLVLVSDSSCFSMVLSCPSLPFQWWSGLRKWCLWRLAPLTQMSTLNVENREALALPISVSFDRLCVVWTAIRSEWTHSIRTHSRLPNPHWGRAWTSDSERGTCVLFGVRSQLSQYSLLLLRFRIPITKPLFHRRPRFWHLFSSSEVVLD